MLDFLRLLDLGGFPPAACFGVGLRRRLVGAVVEAGVGPRSLTGPEDDAVTGAARSSWPCPMF